MEEVYRTFVFLIKKNCYVSASAHLTQQFSCINNVKINRYIVYCPKQFIRQSLLFLHKLRKHRRTYNSQKTGYCNRKAAHGTFYFTQLHCLCSTDSMGRGSKCQALSNRFFNTRKFDHSLCEHISKNTGNDNNCNCNRYYTTPT